MSSKWLTCSAAMLLSACTLADRDVPPESQVVPPAAWRTTVEATAVLEVKWWRRYEDPVLVDLIERALIHNPDVAIAAARVREAQARQQQARSQLFPTIDAVIAGSRGRSVNAFGSAATSSTVEPQLQASWQVDLFGRVRDLVGAARQEYLASQAAHDAATLSIAAAVATSYITLRSLDAQLEVARDTLGARANALEVARSRASVGYTSQLELTQAQAEYEATAQIVPQIEQGIAQQENALSTLLGDAPGSITRGAALDELKIPPIPDDLPAEVLRRRPDVAQAEYQLAASDLNLAAARKAFLPNVQLTGSAGVLRTGALDDISLFSIGASVLAPIFDAGNAAAGRDIAAAARDQAAFNYRAVALGAFREVEDSLIALDRLAEQARHVQAQRDALAEALRHATNRYRAGYSSYLDQLDAQRGLLNAQLSLVQIQADGLTNSVALYEAMGGGWTGVQDR